MSIVILAIIGAYVKNIYLYVVYGLVAFQINDILKYGPENFSAIYQLNFFS